MTTNDLVVIRARAEKATPGPWVTRSLTELYDGKYDGPPGSNLWLATEWQDAKGPNLGADEMLNHDADFVAHARTDVPNLCDEVEALRGELARAREVLEDIAALDGVSAFFRDEYVALLAQDRADAYLRDAGRGEPRP